MIHKPDDRDGLPATNPQCRCVPLPAGNVDWKRPLLRWEKLRKQYQRGEIGGPDDGLER